MDKKQPEVQQATCTNSDSWNCKYCNKTKTCAALAAGQATAAQRGVGITAGMEPAATVRTLGVVGVKFSGWTDYGCSLPDGTKLYTEAQVQAHVTAAPQPSTTAQAADPDGEAFRTAARLGLTLRFYGGCAQSSMPGTPSAYEVVTGSDRAAAMREAVERAGAVIASGGESQRLGDAAQSADSVPAVSDLPPLPAPDLRDVGTKPQEIKEFLKGYATEYARTAIAARATADSVQEDAAREREKCATECES